ncbi:MAG: hypothetical protein U1E65_07645 [Myxococcota bacterium]
MSDDRRKKSWRELDSARDKGGAKTRFDPDERRKEAIEKTQAYSAYKSQLNKLFTPGSGAQLPPELKEKLGPPSAEVQKKQALTEALQTGADAASLKAYLDAGLPLPEDSRLLIRLLDLSDADLLVPVLKSLMAIVSGGQKPSRMLLLQKLDAIALRLGRGEAADLARDLRAELE